MCNIIHISDVHFGSTELVYSQAELEVGIASVIAALNDEDVFLLVTGDITFQGREVGYREAVNFMRNVITKGHVKPENLLLCPGNHDIVRLSNPFRSFDAFSYSLRSDKIFTYSLDNHVLYQRDGGAFLGINTAFRRDHSYGYADVDNIQRTINDAALPDDIIKIAFLHHHLINQFETDVSVLRNAYNILSLLDENKFDYIFHGHQHANQFMPIGDTRMFIFGVSSFNFNTPGFINGFNSYRLSKNSLLLENYNYSRDTIVKGRVGAFTKSLQREVKKR